MNRAIVALVIWNLIWLSTSFFLGSLGYENLHGIEGYAGWAGMQITSSAFVVLIFTPKYML